MTLQKPDPRQTVSFKVSSEKLEAFDEWVEGSTYESRSEALRTLVVQASQTPSDSGTPLVPPTEDRLSEAYFRLCDSANRDGVLRDDDAKTVISSSLGIPKKEVVPTVMKKLHRRNYVVRVGNLYGDVSWKIVGWNDD